MRFFGVGARGLATPHAQSKPLFWRENLRSQPRDVDDRRSV